MSSPESAPGLPPPAVAGAGTTPGSLRRVLSRTSAAAVIGLPIGLLLTPYVLDRVPVDEYGVWSTLGAVLAIAALADLGIRTEIVRRVAGAQGAGDLDEVRRAVRQGCTVLTMIGLVVLAVGLPLAPTVVRVTFPDDPERHAQATLLLVGLLLLFAFGLVLNGYTAVLSGLQRGDYEAIAAVVGTVTAAGTTLVALSLVGGIEALFLGAAVALLLSTAVQVRGIRVVAPEVRFRLCWMGPAQVRHFVRLSAFLLVTGVAALLDTQVDRVLVSRYVDATGAAQYAVGTDLAVRVRTLAALPLVVLLTGLAELQRAQAARAVRLFTRISRLTAAGNALLFGGLVALAPAFLPVWLDPRFDSAAQVAQVISVGLFLGIAGGPLFVWCVANERHRQVAAVAAIGLVVNLVASYALSIRIGVLGPALGTDLAALLGIVLLQRLVSRHAPAYASLRDAGRGVLGVLPAVLLALLLAPEQASWAGFLLLGTGYTVLALLGLVVVGILRPSLLHELRDSSGGSPPIPTEEATR